jgi:hypothetical protein
MRSALWRSSRRNGHRSQLAAMVNGRTRVCADYFGPLWIGSAIRLILMVVFVYLRREVFLR